MEVAQQHQDQLDRIKKNIKNAYDYFRDNFLRFQKFKVFLYKSNWTDSERASLNGLGKPDMEFNIAQSYVDRLLGEFSKQEPSIEIHSDSNSQQEVQIIQFLEQHLNHVINGELARKMQNELWKDLLVGGFSVAKVFAEYKSAMSMDQEIKIERVFDPTLCAFDPMARSSHKGDGRFCCELFPMSDLDFKDKYPEIDMKKFSFVREVEGFNWSYENDKKKILIVADYYEKKKRSVKICKLRDGRVMRYDEYQDMVKSWQDPFSMPPSIIGKPRKTQIEKIVRYRVVENFVIEHTETDYSMLPLVFFSGNSEYLKQNDMGDTYQFCKPYIYHIKDTQKFLNYCASSWANAVENEVQHKWIVKKEAIPKEPQFQRGLTDNQHATTIVVNAFYENDPNQPIMDAIEPVPKVPAPPEIMQGVTTAMQLVPMILGSHNEELANNRQGMSGVAIIEAATLSNSTAMPYMIGYLEGLERCAQIYVDLIPKYYTTPRTIPIRAPDGKRSYKEINQDYNQTFDYDEGIFNVKLKAGASFAMQKSRTLMMCEQFMQSVPEMGQFFSTEGLDFLLRNMECDGIEELRLRIPQWQQQQQQKQQQEMQMQQQQASNNPAMMRNQIDQQKLQFEQQKAQMDHQIEMMKLQIEEKHLHADMQINREKTHADLIKAADDVKIEHMKAHEERIHNAHDRAMREVEHVENVKQSKEKKNDVKKKD